MPEICRFYGIVIKMFFKPKEHEPSHLHALYGEYVGIFGNDRRRPSQEGPGIGEGMDAGKSEEIAGHVGDTELGKAAAAVRREK